MGTPALPRTCCARRLWLWPGQAVYVGPSLGLDPHSGSVSCLVVAVGGTFALRTDTSSRAALVSALVPPRLRHQVVADAEVMAFCYLDPGSRGHRACQRAMTVADGAIAYRHRNEDALAGAAGDLADAGRARRWLELAAGHRSGAGAGPGADPAPTGTTARAPSPLDPRIRDAVATLRALHAGEPAAAADLAAAAGLSPSRFLHLFRDHTGTSFRRYRLWLRMLRAAELLRDGADLTTAAVDAGFASPSHFSGSFHAMFGLRPSQLLGTEIRLT